MEMKYALVDSFGEIIKTDSESVFTISAGTTSTGAKVIGNTDVTVVEGVGTFKDITFIVTPGTQAVQYQVTSSNIDYDKLKKAFNVELSDLL